MNRCPISYEDCEDHYSQDGLRLLSNQLTELKDFPYGQSEQLELAIQYADKLSFSGIQPKLNAALDLKKHSFEVVRTGGSFILKLPYSMYAESLRKSRGARETAWADLLASQRCGWQRPQISKFLCMG